MVILAVIALSIYIAFLGFTIVQSYRKDRQEKMAETRIESTVAEAAALTQAGEPERAIAALAPLHDARPYDEAVGIQLAAACSTAGEFERATRICRWFLASSPESVEFLFQLGEARRGANDLAGAREAYERALAANSQHLVLYRRLSEVYVRQGRLADLQPLWQKAASSLPDVEEVRTALAQALARKPS
jgi:tetratricopeptide (TPR) repeat protein